MLGITKDKKIITIKEKSFSSDRSFYALPGGSVEEGEKPEEAARRELNEETGYDSNKFDLWISENYSQTIISKKYFFVARNCIKANDPNPEITENIRNLILSFNEFLDVAITDDFKHMEIQNYLLKMKLNKSRKDEFLRKYFG